MPSGIIRAVSWTVYMLVDEEHKAYIGSTLNLKRRIQQHNTPVERFKNSMKGKFHYLILEKGIPNNLTARQREHHFIKTIPCCNRIGAYFNRKDFQKSERGKRLQAIYDKRYYLKNKKRKTLSS